MDVFTLSLWLLRLGFVVLIVASLLTQPKKDEQKETK